MILPTPSLHLSGLPGGVQRDQEWSASGGVGAVLRHAPAVRAALRAGTPARSTLLGDMATYHMGWEHRDADPGKLLRGSLCAWACRALGGAESDALSAATAIEWVHNFTLIHDDVQDGDRRRRHRDAVWTVFGVGQAINAGDGLHALAMATILDGDGEPDRRLRAARRLARAILLVVEGQCEDLAMEGRPDAGVDAYLRLAERKTGALFGAALACGACIAGADDDAVDSLDAAGRALGAAFQIRDDWLGSWGDPALTGKARGGDIRRRKFTYAIAAAADVAPADRRDELIRLMETTDDEGVTARILTLLDELDAATLTATAAQRLAAQAVACATALPDVAREELAELATYAATRKG